MFVPSDTVDRQRSEWMVVRAGAIEPIVSLAEGGMLAAPSIVVEGRSPVSWWPIRVKSPGSAGTLVWRGTPTGSNP